MVKWLGTKTGRKEGRSRKPTVQIRFHYTVGTSSTFKLLAIAKFDWLVEGNQAFPFVNYHLMLT